MTTHTSILMPHAIRWTPMMFTKNASMTSWPCSCCGKTAMSFKPALPLQRILFQKTGTTDSEAVGHRLETMVQLFAGQMIDYMSEKLKTKRVTQKATQVNRSRAARLLDPESRQGCRPSLAVSPVTLDLRASTPGARGAFHPLA